MLSIFLELNIILLCVICIFEYSLLYIGYYFSDAYIMSRLYTGLLRCPCFPGKSWNSIYNFPAWKVLENRGIFVEVLECPGK